MQGAGHTQPITDGERDAMLTRGIDAAQRLLEVLAREAAALQRNDAAAIEHTASEKQALLAELKALERRGSLPVLDRHPRGNELRTLLQRCRHENDLNGGVIFARLRHTQQVLEILRGQPGATTYGRLGAAEATTVSQSIAKA